MAPPDGLEPSTFGLTASAYGAVMPRGPLLYRAELSSTSRNVNGGSASNFFGGAVYSELFPHI